MTKEERRASWAKKIQTQSRSGLSIAKWCQQNGINDKTFHRWKSNLKTKEKTQAASSDGWCQIQAKPTVIRAAKLTIVVNGQITIELQTGFDPQLLQNVLAVLCP